MVLLGIAILSLIAIAFTATASISGPKTVTVGQLVTIKANNLAVGDYELFLATPFDNGAKPGQATQCTAPISGLDHARGTASFSGKVPSVLQCRAGLTPDGTRAVTPGTYEFEVDAPVDGHPNRHLTNVIQGVRIAK
jgi:hypothetical protein